MLEAGRIGPLLISLRPARIQDSNEEDKSGGVISRKVKKAKPLLTQPVCLHKVTSKQEKT